MVSCIITKRTEPHKKCTLHIISRIECIIRALVETQWNSTVTLPQVLWLHFILLAEQQMRSIETLDYAINV